MTHVHHHSQTVHLAYHLCAERRYTAVSVERAARRVAYLIVAIVTQSDVDDTTVGKVLHVMVSFKFNSDLEYHEKPNDILIPILNKSPDVKRYWDIYGDLDFLIEADGSMSEKVYRPLYEAGADVVVLGPPALWNKAPQISQAWDIMKKEINQALAEI